MLVAGLSTILVGDLPKDVPTSSLCYTLIYKKIIAKSVAMRLQKNMDMA